MGGVQKVAVAITEELLARLPLQNKKARSNGNALWYA